MRLLEFQAKELFQRFEIPVPRGGVAKTPAEAKEIARTIGFPLIMKPQVAAGGRAKAGAIVRVDHSEEVEPTFTSVIRKLVSGSIPQSILLEEFIQHEKELYLSIALDRGRRSFVLIASKEGGVEVENMGTKVVRDAGVDNLTAQAATQLADEISLSGATSRVFAGLVFKAWEASSAVEAELFEINPVALLSDGTLTALDAKVILDDNALFRHPEFAELEVKNELEKIASSYGFTFVELEGSIAVVGNGAGLVLSTLDLVAESGGKPACFLDLGGGASTERVASALKVVDRFDKAGKILLNIFGGITRCTDVAEGILIVNAGGHLRKPMYARLSGSGAEEAREMLKKVAIKVFDTAEEAVASLVSGE